MKKLILIFLSVMALNASILDFRYLSKAKEAYENKDYKKAIEFYNRVEDKNDEVKFNLADAYYKNKNYKKALELYKEIKDKRLEFKKLHNIGNSLANLGKIDEAIKAYEKALQIKEDKDTRFNLELLKKLKRQKKKNKKQNKQNKKNNKNNKQNQKDQNKNQSDKNKQNSNKGNDKKENQNQNK
ncbi:MAG: tetratricopeptide repeat protein, partial [Epsilonproteobacteria bacterium]|nr:tetratricopeptide repeat protein [Campylobacterota bacterium]